MQHYEIIVDENLLLVTNIKSGRRACAKCHPNDNFSLEFGMRKAFSILLEMDEYRAMVGWGTRGVNLDIEKLKMDKPWIYTDSFCRMITTEEPIKDFVYRVWWIDDSLKVVYLKDPYKDKLYPVNYETVIWA